MRHLPPSPLSLRDSCAFQTSLGPNERAPLKLSVHDCNMVLNRGFSTILQSLQSYYSHFYRGGKNSTADRNVHARIHESKAYARSVNTIEYARARYSRGSLAIDDCECSTRKVVFYLVARYSIYWYYAFIIIGITLM